MAFCCQYPDTTSDFDLIPVNGMVRHMSMKSDSILGSPFFTPCLCSKPDFQSPLGPSKVTFAAILCRRLCTLVLCFNVLDWWSVLSPRHCLRVLIGLNAGLIP